MARNVFVVGLDDLNLRALEAIPDAEDYHFHQLLTIEELQEGHEIRVLDLLDKATAQLEAFNGPIDAIIGYWDFPVSSMVPLLARRFGLPGASLEAVLKCEHKYWARRQQQEVIDEYPPFAVVDPFDDAALRRIEVPLPYWIKPVKAFSSELAYRVSAPDDLSAAVSKIRAGIRRIGDPFEWVLSRVDLPPEIAEVGGNACIVEGEVSGRQGTVEGYVRGGEVISYGVVDSLTYPGTSCFERYQYPSTLPEDVQERFVDVAARLLEQIGLERSTFNMEFFWDAETDRVFVLEVNPRHSQSHTELFALVDGFCNHKIAVDLALGRDPEPGHRQGKYRLAAKWHLRRFEDALVTRSPLPHEVREVEQAIPGTAIRVIAEKGDRLSGLHDQDSYSYKLANVYVGAASEEELADKYRRCAERLPFAFES